MSSKTYDAALASVTKFHFAGMIADEDLRPNGTKVWTLSDLRPVWKLARARARAYMARRFPNSAAA